MIPEISEQGLDSRKETVLQSEPMKQTTEKSSVVITKKTEMGKSKTETEPTESSRLMRGAGNDSPNTSRSSAPKRLLRSRLQRRMQPLSGRGIALNLYQKHIQSRTSRGRQCELSVKKGGNTEDITAFVLWQKGESLFCIQILENKIRKQEKETCRFMKNW